LRKPKTENLTVTTEATGDENVEISAQVLANIKKINSIKLSKADLDPILNHPVLKVLTDKSESISKASPDDIGRNNPFAPLEGTTLPASRSTSTAPNSNDSGNSIRFR